MPSIPSDQAGLRAYVSDLKSQGKTESTSKSLNKAVNMLKSFTPEKFDTEAGGGLAAQIQRGKQKQTPPPTSGGKFGSSEELGSYLNDYQNNIYGGASGGSPELRQSIVDQLQPEGGRPALLNRANEFEKLRQERGVTGLETELNTLKSEAEGLIAEKRQRINAQENKTVALGVIGGRVNEIERQQNERIDAVNRSINTISDQLNTSYQVIQQYMSFLNADYQDATARYNEDFNRNMQVYKLVDDKIDKQQAIARSNLQIFSNAITSGAIDYNSMSTDQRAFVRKLEVQSGLPIGFTASLKAEGANGKMISTTTREVGGQKYVDVVMQMPDGTMKVQSQSLGGVSTGGGSGGTYSERRDAQAAGLQKDMFSALSNKTGSDGKISPEAWQQGLRAWVAEVPGATQEDFVKRFGSFVNTDHSEDYFGYDSIYNR